MLARWQSYYKEATSVYMKCFDTGTITSLQVKLRVVVVYSDTKRCR